MRRSPAVTLIAAALVGYGVHRALYVPGMLVGTGTPLLLVAFVAQAVLGIVAGLAVWSAAGWAPVAIVALGAVVAATALVEAFVLGIIPYLGALVQSVIAVVVAIVVARRVGGNAAA
jgi:hypothetical protein